MVTELLPTLSVFPPMPARRAGLGDRYQYWRGNSGTLYLFSAVPAGTLPDFRSAVAILAEPTGDGRFMAWAVAEIDQAGRVSSPDGSWPHGNLDGTTAFVHFLAATERERLSLIEDIFGPAEAQSFSLAA